MPPQNIVSEGTRNDLTDSLLREKCFVKRYLICSTVLCNHLGRIGCSTTTGYMMGSFNDVFYNCFLFVCGISCLCASYIQTLVAGLAMQAKREKARLLMEVDEAIDRAIHVLRKRCGHFHKLLVVCAIQIHGVDFNGYPKNIFLVENSSSIITEIQPLSKHLQLQ